LTLNQYQTTTNQKRTTISTRRKHIKKQTRLKEFLACLNKEASVSINQV